MTYTPSATTCPACGGMVWAAHLAKIMPPHVCPPQWEVCDAEDRDPEWETLYADDAQAAACAWLERQHQGCAVYEQEVRECLVRRAGTDVEPERYGVTMQMEPSYSAWRGGL